MSQKNDKFNVIPTPMMLRMMKTRLETARKGYDILKRKSDVLEMRFRKLGKEIVIVKENMGKVFEEASVHLAEARYVTSDFNTLVLSSVSKARVKVTHTTEHIAGVKLTRFESYQDGPDTFLLTGLSKGGSKVRLLKQTYQEAIKISVELASLQTSFVMLDEVIKSLKRRVNALETSYIPKCLNSIKYIEDEIDENSRQEFFRMKRVKNIKKQKQEKEQAEMRERMKKEKKEQDIDNKDGEREKEDHDKDEEKEKEDNDGGKDEEVERVEEKSMEKDNPEEEIEKKDKDDEKVEKENMREEEKDKENEKIRKEDESKNRTEEKFEKDNDMGKEKEPKEESVKDEKSLGNGTNHETKNYQGSNENIGVV